MSITIELHVERPVRAPSPQQVAEWENGLDELGRQMAAVRRKLKDHRTPPGGTHGDSH
jgi:hypothetical protein